jgi:hypothetical protein
MLSRLRIPLWWGVCGLLAIAAFFLWEEHSAHFLGAIPYIFLLACPLMHFMHRRHGGHGSGHKGHCGPGKGDHT